MPKTCTATTAADDLDEILAWRVILRRTGVLNNLTLHYDRMMLLLDPTPFTRGFVRKKIEVVNYPDGRFVVQFEGTPPPFRLFGQDPDRATRRDCGEQAPKRRAGFGERAARHLCAEAASSRPARGRPPNNLEAPGLPTKNGLRRNEAAVLRG